MNDPNFPNDEKYRYRAAIIPEMMSSEDEQEDDEGNRYFVIHKPEFRSKRFENLLTIIDNAYTLNRSKRATEQMIPRKVGAASKRTAPKTLEGGLEKLFVK